LLRLTRAPRRYAAAPNFPASSAASLPLRCWRAAPATWSGASAAIRTLAALAQARSAQRKRGYEERAAARAP